MSKRIRRPALFDASRRVTNAHEARRHLFIENYLTTFDVQKACEAAGYGRDGDIDYQQKLGRKLLRDKKVADVIERRLTDSLKGIGINKGRVLVEIKRIATFDARKLFFDDGTPIPIQDLDDDTAACVSGVEVIEQFEGSGENRRFTGYLKKYRICDKNKALDMLGKNLRLFGEDVNNAKDRLDEVLDALREPGEIVESPKAEKDKP